jgi:hypothetical protein
VSATFHGRSESAAFDASQRPALGPQDTDAARNAGQLVAARALVLKPGNARDQKFRINAELPVIGPYVFTNEACGIREPGRNCFLLKDVIFDMLGVIPTYCMKRCWKIVITVDTVADLFALLEVMKERQWPGKCGFDPRSYTFGNYVGFCYFDSREAGEEAFESRLAAVRERVPKAEMYLKRSCTEYELKAPSDTWNEKNAVADALVEILEECVEWDFVDFNPTEYNEKRVKNYWIEQAYNRGDTTLSEVVTDYQDMYLQSVKYKKSWEPAGHK